MGGGPGHVHPSGVSSGSVMEDAADGYGWISIALHWAGAAGVIVLLVAGTAIHSRGGDFRGRLDLHTSLAVSLYPLLWARVIWRFVKGHPGPLPRQGRFSFAIAKPVHMLMLAAVGVMLVSGPLMAWAAGAPVRLFALAIPAPYGASPGLWSLMHTVHVAGGNFITAAVLLHIGAAVANGGFKRDGGFDKIMIAARPADAAAREQERHG